MYVVTGATGKTGTVVAKALLARNEKVRAVGRNPEKLRFLSAKGAEPFIADYLDIDKLTQAFRGADAAYVLIPPPSSTTTNYREDQDRISDSIATALKNAGVKRIVSLSSVGADKSDKTGPVIGLRNFEQKLNGIEDANVLHLRPGYFMENTLGQVATIRTLGAVAGPLRPDLKVSMIATRDIGAAAAEALLKRDFQAKQTRELRGPEDITMAEAAATIGRAIGKPGLVYVQAPDDQVLDAFQHMGLPENVGQLILEMSVALNSGHMRPLEPRSTRNTTPTSYEAFVAEEFVPLYQQQAAA